MRLCGFESRVNKKGLESDRRMGDGNFNLGLGDVWWIRKSNKGEEEMMVVVQ